MAAHREEFSGGPKEEDTYIYEFNKWKPWGSEEGDWRKFINDSDLPSVEDLVVRIENPETGQVTYNTLTGPFEDWDIVRELIEYDWGPEGDSDIFAG